MGDEVAWSDHPPEERSAPEHRGYRFARLRPVGVGHGGEGVVNLVWMSLCAGVLVPRLRWVGQAATGMVVPVT